jgi:exopolyphosphatase/guanosine-5'-triphosphate,3'-diphosphate pyrophosphatase
MLVLQHERQQYRTQRQEEFLAFWRHIQEQGVWEHLQHTLAVPLAPASTQTRQSVLELAKHCDYEEAHARHVTDLALKLFDALQPLHALGATERCWLEYAALLHDIGWVEGRRRHHKVALRYILDSPLLLFENRERLLLGSIVRYHRRALPSLAHEHFAALDATDQQTVSALAGILRVAEGLDCTHRSIVQDLTCEVTEQHIVVHCVSTEDAEPEQQSAMAKGRLLEKTLQRALVLT